MKIFLIAGLAILISGTGYGQSIHILSPKGMTFITKIDERFQSYNIEMAEVIGRNFWKPYNKQASNSNTSSAAKTSDKKKFEIGGQDTTMYEKRSPIDLYNERLRRLAAALGPVYMRVSGTWANTVFFQDDNSNSIASPPKGFKGVLTRAHWRGVVDFSNAVNVVIMTSFAISQGVRNADGIWTSDQASLLVAYSKSIGGKIGAAELKQWHIFFWHLCDEYN
jgi:heparanase 1